jgi:hypothetical protein
MILALLTIAGFAPRLNSEQTDKLSLLVGETNAAQLAVKGEISRYLDSSATLTLFPNRAGKQAMIDTVKAINPTICVEIAKLSTNARNGCPDSACMIDIYNTLRAISTLKGIEYYSASRKRMRIFYEDAFIVNTPGEKKRIEDSAEKEIPATSNLFCFLKDSSFGEYVCSIEYGKEADSISMKMQNLTKIWYLFIPIIEPNNMLTYIIIIPLDKGMLFYGFSAIKGDDVFGIAKSRADSLYNRLIALYNWFDRCY